MWGAGGSLAPNLPGGFGDSGLSNLEDQPNALLCRVILLLTNSFDLEDGFLTASNLEQVKGYLASAYPSRYSEVSPQIRNCSLESELDTVRRGPGQRAEAFALLLPAGQEPWPPWSGCCCYHPTDRKVRLGSLCPTFLFLFSF